MAEPKKELSPAQKAKKVADDRKKETLRLKQSKEREALHKSLKNEYDPVKEASTKANKLHIMHAAKLIAKMKSGHEKENAISDLEKKAKKMGFSRADYERIIDGQGAYEETMKNAQEEAEKMNGYLNVLSLDRSVNLWEKAAKKDEDVEPVKGSKTLTKKTQEKITINPMEKEVLRK